MSPLPVPPLPKGAEQFGAWWDEAAAQAATDFFPRYLRHTEGEWAGKPFVLADWQRDQIIRPVFGWKRADGTRLIRIVWIEVPRKNGKTELAAGISLLMLLGDGEKGGQVYSMAVDKDQAKIVFNKAGTMIGFSEALRKNVEVYKTSIFCPQLIGSFKPLSSGPGGKHGFSPTGAIGDEVHEWPDGELADVVHKGMAARRQPLEIYITTAGLKDHGYAWEMHELAMQILDGSIVDPSFLPVIFAANDDEDWTSEEAARRANPNFGVSVKPQFIADECAKAKRSPRAENDYKRFHLNLWTEQATRWIPMSSWKSCTLQPQESGYWRALEEEVRGRKCWGGLDLSSTRDVTALAWSFPPEGEDDRWIILWRHWLPALTVQDQPPARRMKYEAFARSGALTLTGGNVIDYNLISRQVLADRERYNVQALAVDRWNATQTAVDLQGEGVNMVMFGQGFASMSAPSKEFERMVVGELLEHGNNPVAKWMAENAVVETDAAGNIKPSKAKAPQKIDGIVAAVMSVGIVPTQRAAEPSIYTRRGLRMAG